MRTGAETALSLMERMSTIGYPASHGEHDCDPHSLSHGNPPEPVIVASPGRGADDTLVGLSDKSCLFLSPRAAIVQNSVDQMTVSPVLWSPQKFLMETIRYPKRLIEAISLQKTIPP